MHGPKHFFEILTPAEMYRADALAVERFKIPSLRLMEYAGRAVVTKIVQRFKKCPIAVICGPGNNGGDGFVVARLLAAKKWPVKVYLLAERAALKGDAAAMASKWKGKVGSFADFEKSLVDKAGPRLIVDAIFGAGLNRDFPALWANGILGAGVPVVAIDVPSGLDGLSGQKRGACVVADLTVTFFRKKLAHVLQPGRVLCGEVVVAAIGIPEGVLDEIKPQLFENSAPDLPLPHVDDHKFTRGYALVWSGPEFATGASRLAAKAAARAGAGLVSLVGKLEALRIHAAQVSSMMLKPVSHFGELQALLEDQRLRAFCIGPAAGVSEDLRRTVLLALRIGPAMVLDADALTAFAEMPGDLFAAIMQRPDRPVILTPHEGEFALLFSLLAAQSINKIERAQAAARVSGATVLLKGSDTVIAAPNGRAVVNTNAPAKLATAGSGDVLAGIITGLLAQGMEGFDAACAGAWLHGEAANKVQRRTLMAEDLLEHIGQ
jgi:ADP-dependent NAD(P)H-hydrate dehydratase / NAD(P)H-hydrate epimerase